MSNTDYNMIEDEELQKISGGMYQRIRSCFSEAGIGGGHDNFRQDYYDSFIPFSGAIYNTIKKEKEE